MTDWTEISEIVIGILVLVVLLLGYEDWRSVKAYTMMKHKEIFVEQNFQLGVQIGKILTQVFLSWFELEESSCLLIDITQDSVRISYGLYGFHYHFNSLKVIFRSCQFRI